MLAKTGPLKQVLAAMGINHTVMNPGWVTAHQRTHESPSVHERDSLVWGLALFRFINCVIGNEENFVLIPLLSRREHMCLPTFSKGSISMPHGISQSRPWNSSYENRSMSLTQQQKLRENLSEDFV